MGSENLQLITSILEDWGRGDYSASDWADPEIEFVRVGGPSPGVWRGHEGMVEATRDWLIAWADSRVEVDEYREIDDGRVLALVRIAGRGRRSGVELERVSTGGAHVFHVKGGKVTRFVHYMDRERAFDELGIAAAPD